MKSQAAQAASILIISGLAGFRVGMVSFPDWQVAVETAQVVAGIVDYPAGNPFYVYHTKLWTVLHQVCALLLLSGVSEIALSKILSGLLGMVSFQALSMIVYALGRDPLLAIGSAFLIFVTRVSEYGVAYPIYLMGATHTYGILGLSTIALIAGLLGAGSYRTGGFLLGVAPAIHPSLGGWFAAVVGFSSVWHFGASSAELRPALKYFLAGCGVTAASLAAHLTLTYDAPPIGSELYARYLSVFVAFWDGHRQPVNATNEGVVLGVGAFALALLWLTAFAHNMSRSAVFLLRLVVVSGALSLGLLIITRVPPERLPSSLLILMPGRFLNFNALIAAPLVLGLIGMTGRTVWSALLTLYLSVGVLIGNRSMLWDWLETHTGSVARHVVPGTPTRPLQILLTVTVLLVTGAAVVEWRTRRAMNAGTTPAPRARAGRIATITARIAVLGVLAWTGAMMWQLPPRMDERIFTDRTNDSLFALAAQGRGLLLTGGDLHLVQLRTRRPVLLDGGGLDGLPYAVEAAPATERILRDVYEIDLFNPPEDARLRGVIPNGTNRAAWERHPLERWQAIKRTYDVHHVLTDANWTLSLPVSARNALYLLYEIPD